MSKKYTIFVDYNRTLVYDFDFLRPDAQDFIKEIRKMADSVCILSNDAKSTVKAGFKKHKLLDMFDAIYDETLYNLKKDDLKNTENFVLIDDAPNGGTSWYKKMHVLGKINYTQLGNFQEIYRKSIADFIDSRYYIQCEQFTGGKCRSLISYIPDIKTRFELQTK